MSRTPLFAVLRRAAGLARMASRPGAPGLSELADPAFHRSPLSRRTLLAAGAMLPALPARAASDARVAILGGGLAGLVVADRLRAAGMRNVTLYEASNRTGGRTLSARDVLGPGTVVEFGGSFINSDHADMLALAQRFGLPVEDGQSGEAASLETTFFVAGERRGLAEIAASASSLVAHLARLKRRPKAEQDALSAAAVLDGARVSGWSRRLIDIGLTQEMGLEPERMSGLHLIDAFAADHRTPSLGLFGSDQRYQIAGGNDRVAAALAATLNDRIRLGRRVEAIRPAGRAYRLSFAGGHEVTADLVVLALPLTTLRQVHLGMDLPPLTRRAILETRYGSNAKLFAGLSARPWRAARQNGECIGDVGAQSVWEDDARPGTGPGALTIFAGGRAGMGFASGVPADRARAVLHATDRALPGVAAGFTGRAARTHWPSSPYALGSYSCFGPNQYEGLSEALGPAGQVHFAGERASGDHSGYMNGAAESGRVTAEGILRRIR